MAGTGTGVEAPSAAADDAAAQAKAADELATASETPAVSVDELPAETFAEPVDSPESTAVEMGEEAPPEKPTEPKAEKPAEEPAKPEEPAAEPAKPAEPAETPAETPAEEPQPFDAQVFADKYGVADSDLFSKCKDDAAAREVLCRQSAHWSRLYGNQSQEVGTLRARVAEHEAQQPAVPPAAAAAPAPATGGVVPEMASLTEQELETYHELHDRDPVKAFTFMQERLASGLPGPVLVTPDQVSELVQQGIATAQADRSVDAETAALAEKHPGWEARWPQMNVVAEELGTRLPMSEWYDLTGLRDQDPDAYGRIVAKLREYPGMPLAEAQTLCVEQPTATPAAPAQTVEQEQAARVEAARIAGTGGGAMAAVTPAVETEATSLSELGDVAGRQY